MTDFTSEFSMRDDRENRIVYIRAIDPEDLPAEARAQSGADAFYAIHDGRGNRLAVTVDRETAFQVARSNALTPVSAH